MWVAPLVAPAVDLSILGLLLAIRHLAINGATPDQLRPARRLLVFASMVTLALNVAHPMVAGEYGKAAFDAVGPLLLIGWAEVGPGLLQAMAALGRSTEAPQGDDLAPLADPEPSGKCQPDKAPIVEVSRTVGGRSASEQSAGAVNNDLLEQAVQEDARHWVQYRRPISTETLRKRLGVGAARSRVLVSRIRSGQTVPPSLSAVRNAG